MAINLLLQDTLTFIDDYLEEQGDYSSIALEESAAELRNRLASFIPSRRIDVYHILLMMWIKATYVAEKCMFCNAILNYGEPHKPDCLRELTRRAVNADEDELKALLERLVELN